MNLSCELYNMNTKILGLALVSSLFFASCKETPKQENEAVVTETSEKNTDEIVTSSATDKDGKKLEMSFNNTKNTVTIDFDDEIIELDGEKSASGIHYKNDTYELTGKGENVELKKEGKTIFKN